MDEYGEMDEYGDMDEYNYEYDYNVDVLQRTKSLENQQVNINNLMDKILEEVDEIDKYTCFGRDWSLLYYYSCGWKKTLCQEFVNKEEKHKNLISFTKEFI